MLAVLDRADSGGVGYLLQTLLVERGGATVRLFRLLGKELPDLSEDETAIIYAGPYKIGTRSIWGLNVATRMRTRRPPYHGPIIIVSFLPEVDLQADEEGSILATAGVRFLRLPVRPEELAAAVRDAVPLSADEWSAVDRDAWRRAAAGRAAVLRHRFGSTFAVPLATVSSLCTLLLGRSPPDGYHLANHLMDLARPWSARRPDVEAFLSEVEALVEGARLRVEEEQRIGDSLIATEPHNLLGDLDRLASLATAIGTPTAYEELRAVVLRAREGLESIRYAVEVLASMYAQTPGTRE